MQSVRTVAQETRKGDTLQPQVEVGATETTHTGSKTVVLHKALGSSHYNSIVSFPRTLAVQIQFATRRHWLHPLVYLSAL